MKQCWINLYATGWYHRVGKKGTMNAHPGDMYETEEAARKDIDPNAPYLATVACMVPNEVVGLGTYQEDDPLALSTSRNWHLQGVEYMRGLPVPTTVHRDTLRVVPNCPAVPTANLTAWSRQMRVIKNAPRYA